MKHLLVTNDFPPKIGGIQSYLWELWRRLPAEEAVVLTTPFDGADRFDLDAPMRIERIDAPVMLPTRAVRRRILDLAEEIDADLVLLDPALPLGHLGPGLGRRYGLILHGAEVTVPGRVPGPRNVLARTLRGADLVIAAGGYPADEGELAARRGLPVVVVPPGVDVERFRPATPEQRRSTREALGLRDDDLLVVSLSRLVPRKGFDVLIDAAALLRRRYPNLHVLIGGSGRDAGRLRRRASAAEAPVRFLGRVDDADVPGLYAAADVFSMACRNRWFGLEQEGFGIVFLEAAACGVPQVAGDSGGAAEAVEDGTTGIVVADPSSVDHLVTALDTLLGDADLRAEMGASARKRVEEDLSYDVLAARLQDALVEVCSR